MALLRLLWETPHPARSGEWAYSVTEIGRRMNRSKNSIVGKGHRLGLSPRKSPIKRSPLGFKRQSPVSTYPREKKPGGNNSTLSPLNRINPMPDRRLRGDHTLPTLPSEIVAVVADIFEEPAPIIIAPPPPAPVVVVPRFRRQSADACAFPTGTSPRIVFECEATAEPGKPYCVDHNDRCFIKVRRRNPAEEFHGSEIE